MPKNDAARTQTAIDREGSQSQNLLNNLREDTKRQNQGLENRFNVGADAASQDYGNIQQGYRDFLSMANNPNTYGALPGYDSMASGGRDAQLDPLGLSAVRSSIGGYQNFADTGGYQPGDIAAMRARAQGSIRSAYDEGTRNIGLAKSRHSGYSPNETAAIAKLTRDQAESAGNANIALEAALADQIRSGKLAGLGGLSSTGNAQQGLGLSRDSLNNQTRMAGLQGRTGIDQLRVGANQAGLSGMNSSYGTTPGTASMYGQLLNQNSSQLTQQQQLQQAIASMIIGGQQNKSTQPGNADIAMGRIGGVGNIVGKVAGMF